MSSSCSCLARKAMFNRYVAGFYNLAPTGNFGNGTNSNNFAYEDADGNTYTRQVNAAFNNITLDRIGGSLASIST